MSVPPPGVNPTTSRIGLVGNVWADAGAPCARSASAMPIHIRRRKRPPFQATRAAARPPRVARFYLVCPTAFPLPEPPPAEAPDAVTTLARPLPAPCATGDAPWLAAVTMP